MPFTLIRNAEIFAPEPLRRGDVLIAGERVAAVGEDLPDLPSRYGVDVIDLEGRRLIPGFIDGHAHITGGGGEAGYETRVPPLFLSDFTLGGITTVVGLLGTDDLVRTPSQLVAAAYGLRAEGLGAFCFTGGYHVPPVTTTGSVRGDIVSIDPVIGVGEIAISDHRSSQPTRDELLRIASEAHVAGLMTGKGGILHLHVGDGQRGLELIRECLDVSEIPPRVFQPTHINRRRTLFEEALDLAARGCHVDVTAFPVEDNRSPRGPRPCETEEDELSAESALLAYLGTDLPKERITVSTDGGGCLPVFDATGRVESMGVGCPSALADSLRRLLEGGVDLPDVLPAFTSNVAQLLRLQARGRIAVGCVADLVALDDQHRVEHVWARGRKHVTSGRADIRGTFE